MDRGGSGNQGWVLWPGWETRRWETAGDGLWHCSAFTRVCTGNGGGGPGDIAGHGRVLLLSMDMQQPLQCSWLCWICWITGIYCTGIGLDRSLGTGTRSLPCPIPGSRSGPGHGQRARTAAGMERAGSGRALTVPFPWQSRHDPPQQELLRTMEGMGASAGLVTPPEPHEPLCMGLQCLPGASAPRSPLTPSILPRSWCGMRISSRARSTSSPPTATAPRSTASAPSAPARSRAGREWGLGGTDPVIWWRGVGG